MRCWQQTAQALVTLHSVGQGCDRGHPQHVALAGAVLLCSLHKSEGSVLGSLGAALLLHHIPGVCFPLVSPGQGGRGCAGLLAHGCACEGERTVGKDPAQGQEQEGRKESRVKISQAVSCEGSQGWSWLPAPRRGAGWSGLGLAWCWGTLGYPGAMLNTALGWSGGTVGQEDARNWWGMCCLAVP